MKIINQLEENHDYFLLSTVYDAASNGAGIKLLDVQKNKIIYVTDPYGHEPYCFSREPLKKVQSIQFPSGIVKRIDMIEKRNLLEGVDEKLTRIVTPTPSEVPKVRDAVRKASVGETWESRIKYHRNWIYDVQLIPGRKYWWDSRNKKFIDSQSISTGLDIPENVLHDISKYEDLVDVFKDDFTQEIPDMKIVACDIETDFEEGLIPQASDPKFQIICICFADNHGKEFALLLQRKGIKEGKKSELMSSSINIEKFSDEKALIRRAFELLNSYPIIVTFNGDNFDFPYLHERARHLGMRDISPIIWNRRTNDCNFQYAIHIDLYRFYHNVAIRTYAFGNVYTEETLDAIALALLGIGKILLKQSISELSEWDLIHYCSHDARITRDLLLFDNRTPLNLIFMLARISRTPIDDLVRTSVSNWVQSLFYYEHRRRRFLIPNQEDIQQKKGLKASSNAIIKGKKYKGATVIDPVPGVHFNVAVLDFSSLYPSIISTFNLSYETIMCPHPECKDNNVPQTNYWVCKENRGIVADIIGFIKDVRVQWLKPESKGKGPYREYYKILERSLKVLINASYGVLGSDRFPLYCLPVADSTTAYGRDAIERAIRKAQNIGVKVLYGDTDSVFLLAPTEEQINDLIKWSQTDLGVGLEMDKIYRYVVLSERKKNYFGVYPDSNVDVKGLVGKKRNTPFFLQEEFKKVLSILSTVNTPNQFDEAKIKVKDLIRNIYTKLEKKKYSPEELAITMQMTQPLEKYKVNAQHVKAAWQLEKFYRKKGKLIIEEKDKKAHFIKAGQLIRFVKTSSSDRVTPVELVDEKSFIDVKAYKTMVETTFDQLLGALDIEIEELSSGQVNLMEFFS